MISTSGHLIPKFPEVRFHRTRIFRRPVNEAYRYPVHNDLGYTRNSDWNNSPYLLPLYNRKYDLPLDTSWWRKQVFTYVGRIDTNKGLSFIILAWIKLYKKYGNNCPPLWIIGGSPDEINDFHDDLSLEIESIEKTGKIIWWGTLDAEAISAVYLRTIAVIMHSKYEPGGRVSLEAMTSGVPVIATKCGFAKDMIIDWSNGFLIEYGDIESLSQKMECFIKQPYLSSALGISAAKTAELLSSEWDFLKAHIKVYEQAINGLNPKNERMAQIHSNFASDYINVYPYNNPRIDIELIKKYVNKFFTAPEYNVSSLEPQDHFFRWLITTNATSEKHYWVNQPYTYINLLVFTSSSKKFKYVIEAQNRYLCLKKWSSRIPTNILYFCDDLYFIISEESPKLNIQNNLDKIIKFIQKYSLSYKDDQNLSDTIVKMQNEGKATDDIYDKYRKNISSLHIYTEGNFSYILEAQKILQDLHLNMNIKKRIEESCLKTLQFLSEETFVSKKFVLSGFVMETPLISKNTLGELIVCNCEYLHPAFPGEDFAKLLLLTAGEYNIGETLKCFPLILHKDILAWSVVLICQYILYLDTIDSKNIEINILLKKLSTVSHLYIELFIPK